MRCPDGLNKLGRSEKNMKSLTKAREAREAEEGHEKEDAEQDVSSQMLGWTQYVSS